jgi:uncharacterized protein (TIGR03083 family)
MDAAKVYIDVHVRLTRMAAELGAETAVTVPATPAWTVRDVYAHVTGVCADILDGRLRGIPDEAATQRQVDERAHLDLARVCEQWSGRVGAFERLAGGPKGSRYLPTVVDVWTHEQDVLAAVGRPLLRSDPSASFIAATLASAFQARWPATGLPAVAIVGGGGDWLLGRGRPAATLRATDFEIARMLIGRRSRAQMLAMGWDADPAPFVDRLHAFGPPEQDLVE